MSGLSHTPGKRARGKTLRGFESRLLRQNFSKPLIFKGFFNCVAAGSMLCKLNVQLSPDLCPRTPPLPESKPMTQNRRRLLRLFLFQLSPHQKS